tara:strand:- start:3239 stop:3667 length:429 start_codon:yes stop_codon:yes gene_type:complete
MLTKKVKNRISFLILLITVLIALIFFVIKTLNENVLYFLTPTEVSKKQDIQVGKKMRIGGMVKEKSIFTQSEEIKFIITDLKNEIIVTYSGTVPNLFSEGKGVIAEGKLKDKKFFEASRILAKHDENYMPPSKKNLINKDAE